MFNSAFSLIFMLIFKPLIIDSTIYTVDVHKMEVRKQTLAEDIIDYSLDDFLYITHTSLPI
ncbi:hypothetical protein ES705_07798 [subsurface metagenome]